MESNENKNDEYSYSIQLYKMGYLKGPKEYKCGRTSFSIQNDANNKTSGCIFSCINYKCKLKYSIRINSLFDNLPNIKLSIISEIIKAFICLDLNVGKNY